MDLQQFVKLTLVDCSIRTAYKIPACKITRLDHGILVWNSHEAGNTQYINI